MAGRLPAVRRRGQRGAVHRCRRQRVHRLLPRRHRCDDRSRAAPGGRGDRSSGRARHHDDAADGRRDLGRGRAHSAVPAPVVADGDDGDRRQPLRAALRPPSHRASEDLRDGLVLPRHGRRDARRARRDRRSHRSSGVDRPPGGSGGDDSRRAVQRSRCAGDGARPRRRGGGADGTGVDEHRHRPARPGLPRSSARAHPPVRRVA